MRSMVLLESLNLRDEPENVNIQFLPSKYLSKIDCHLTNNRSNPINLSVIGTILIPSDPKYNRLVVCSVLNDKYPESLIIKAFEKIKITFQTILVDNFEYLPNKFITYKINSNKNDKLIKLIQRHLIARRKIIRGRTHNVCFKHGEKSYFKITHLFDSVQKLMRKGT